MEKMQQIGEAAFNAEQIERRDILDKPLAEHSDGRKKTPCCTAVNLLDLEDLRHVMAQVEGKPPGEIVALLKERAGELKLRRKP